MGIVTELPPAGPDDEIYNEGSFSFNPKAMRDLLDYERRKAEETTDPTTESQNHD